MINFEEIKILINPQYHDMFDSYSKLWKLGWTHFIDLKFSSETKYEKIKLLDKAVRKEFPLKKNILHKLQDFFLQENLSLYLILDLLIGWKYLSANKKLDSLEQLFDVISYLTSAPARLIMVLNDENPSTYLPMQSILTAIIFNNLIKEKNYLIQNIKITKKKKEHVINGLIKDGFTIMKIVKSNKLKFKLALFINKQKLLMFKNKQEKITFIDIIKILSYSVYQFITVRKCTIERRGY